MQMRSFIAFSAASVNLRLSFDYNICSKDYDYLGSLIIRREYGTPSSRPSSSNKPILLHETNSYRS